MKNSNKKKGLKQELIVQSTFDFNIEHLRIPKTGTTLARTMALRGHFWGGLAPYRALTACLSPL
ncbi:hypothetical protein [Duganella phyllosphaerae]|uniref:hypothetical protein n=1 Tax=Duganella phyllosphaerae TaxID=762836 RepID=UPI00142895B5|nr:hypothetical protein [Duganella phyllosphaerae]